MERQKQVPGRVDATGGGGPLADNDLDSIREKLAGMHSAVDGILNSIPPVSAEEYLQRGRQEGAQ